VYRRVCAARPSLATVDTGQYAVTIKLGHT
jgi:hypothetical protein